MLAPVFRNLTPVTYTGALSAVPRRRGTGLRISKSHGRGGKQSKGASRGVRDAQRL